MKGFVPSDVWNEILKEDTTLVQMFHVDWDLNELSIVKAITSKNNNYKLFINLSNLWIQGSFPTMQKTGSSAKPSDQELNKSC